MLDCYLDGAGGIRAPAFTDHIAKEAFTEAQTLKQGRLLREERAMLAKKGKGKGKETEAPPPASNG